MKRSALLVGFITMLAGYCNGQIVSSFNTTAEGWTASGAATTGSFQWVSTGGNPGGYVRATDFNSAGPPVWYFVAPAAFVGNQSAYYNGTISFDLAMIGTSTPAIQRADIILSSGTTSLYYFNINPATPSNYPTFTRYTIPINELSGNWKTSNSPTGTAATQSDFTFTLTNMISFQIRGRFYGGVIVSSALDNVNLTRFFVSTQPTSTAVCNGTTATFTTVATGNSSMTYQWQKLDAATGAWNNITSTSGYSGTATGVLSVNTTGNFGGGTYRCVISGVNANNIVSNAATLTINALPASPAATGNSACGPASITLNASGGTSGQYRWYNVPTGGAAIASQTNSSYSTPVLFKTTTYYTTLFNGTCESLRTPVVATINPCGNQPPVIALVSPVLKPEGAISINLLPLISDPDNNADLTTLRVVTPPSSGAAYSIDAKSSTLSLDYKGLSFSGSDVVTLEVCDVLFACSQRTVTITVAGDIIIYNAVSPNNDSKNDYWLIQYIDLFDDTKSNHTSVFNRWGDVVFETDNYDNVNRVFTGIGKNGSSLPSGAYFYKIEFPSGRKTETGYLSLKR